MPEYSELERIFIDRVLPPRIQAQFDVPLKELIGGTSRLRLDFVVKHHTRIVAFEIDGHESHFTDPKQIRRDETKDKLCLEHGIELYRLLPSLVTRTSVCKRLVKKWIFTKPYPTRRE
jgi:hypothetical protein